MASQRDPSPSELTAFEATLAALEPARARLDRDRVMYRAGLAVRERPAVRWAWPSAAAALLAVCVGQSILLSRMVPPIPVAGRPTPPPPVRDVEKPAVAVVHPSLTGTWGLSQSPQGRLTWQLLRYGLDGLPPSRMASGRREAEPAASVSVLLEEEVQNVLEPGRPS